MHLTTRAALTAIAVWTFGAWAAAAQTGTAPLAMAPSAMEAPVKVGGYLRGERHDFKAPTYGAP